jgi:hypothetical protein
VLINFKHLFDSDLDAHQVFKYLQPFHKKAVLIRRRLLSQLEYLRRIFTFYFCDFKDVVGGHTRSATQLFVMRGAKKLLSAKRLSLARLCFIAS